MTKPTTEHPPVPRGVKFWNLVPSNSFPVIVFFQETILSSEIEQLCSPF